MAVPGAALAVLGAAGVTGLFVWRWLSTLAAFGIAWLTARRAGATGFAALLAIGFAALVYSQRSDVRPETLVAVLLALEIAELERLRAMGGGPLPLVAIAWIWANSHVSWPLFFLVLLAHLVGASGVRRTFAIAAAASAVAIFIHPSGFRAVSQPFEFAFRIRHEPLFATIVELQPIDWSIAWRSGLPVLMAAWPLLLMRRAIRSRLDVPELLLCLGASAAALAAQRFSSTYAVTAAPYVARDLHAWAAARRWPRWTRPASIRALATAVACVAFSVPEWTWDRLPLGVAYDMRGFPVAAVDFAAAHRVAGRGFNHMHQGDYLAWRAWPDRARLPFMTGTPEASTPEERALYLRALSGREGWEAAQRRFAFDYAILDRHQDPGDSLLDVLDDDPAWAAVFLDDAGALFVRRAAFAGLADSFAYRAIPAGNGHLVRLFPLWEADASRRASARAELARQISASPRAGIAHRLLADIEGLEGHMPEARRHLEAALAENPQSPRAHLLLGGIALAESRAGDALREFELQRRDQRTTDLDVWIGRAQQALGDRAAAQRAYRRALEIDPGSRAARDSLTALGG
jgi:tetratricopeptide (TPR) repeat protein